MRRIDEINLTDTGLLPDLIQDYLNEFDGVRHLYAYPPSVTSFQLAINNKKKNYVYRQALVDAFKRQYADIPESVKVQENLRLLHESHTFTVTAAHQPCLLLGPLYNIWKIAGAVKLSIELKKAYPDSHFVPVFWLGTEDHDWDEVNHTYINGKRMEWERSASGAVGRLSLEKMEEVLAQLKMLRVDSAIVEWMESTMNSKMTFGRFTQLLANELFKEYGLLVLDQDDAELKSCFSSVMADELMQQKSVHLLSENLRWLEENYTVQATPRDINLFYMDKDFRERIIYDGQTQQYQIHQRDLTFTKEQILDELSVHPERFSPNVILRPLYQEIILPNVAFIGGSGELSYWLQLKPIFDANQTDFPILLPRNSAAILTHSVSRKLDKLSLKPSAFFNDTETLIKDYVRMHTTADTDLSEEKKMIENLFCQISDKAEKIDVTLKQSVASEKQKMLNSLQSLEAKMLKAEKRNQDTAVSQIWAVEEALFPMNKPQERSENFIPYFSDDFICRSIEEMNPLEMKFKFFEL